MNDSDSEFFEAGKISGRALYRLGIANSLPAFRCNVLIPDNVRVEMDKELWEATRQERHEDGKRWLIGPHTEEELIEKLGHLRVAARRFGARQGDKVRPIDDMAGNFLNAGVTAVEKVHCGGRSCVIDAD